MLARMAKSAKNTTTPKNFEEAMSELEGLLAEIEGGQLGLEDSLTKYERGHLLIQYCRTVLSAAEQQVERISRGPDGQPVTSTTAESTASLAPTAVPGVPPQDAPTN